MISTSLGPAIIEATDAAESTEVSLSIDFLVSASLASAVIKATLSTETSKVTLGVDFIVSAIATVGWGRDVATVVGLVGDRSVEAGAIGRLLSDRSVLGAAGDGESSEECSNGEFHFF